MSFKDVYFKFVYFIGFLIGLVYWSLSNLRNKLVYLSQDEEVFREKTLDFDWKKEGF